MAGAWTAGRAEVAAMSPLAPSQPPERLKSTLWLAVRAGLSVGLIWWLAQRFGPDLAGLRLVHAWPLAAALAVAALILPALNAVRWRALLNRLGAPARLDETYRVVLIGQFFAYVLPAIGGELMRLFYARRLATTLPVLATSVALDRLAALAALLAISTAAGPVLVLGYGAAPFWWLASAVAVAGLIGLAALGGLPAMAAAVGLARFLPGWLTGFSRDLAATLLNPVGLAATLPLALLVQLLCGVMVALIAVALDAPLSWVSAIALTPLVLLAAAMPISIGGWGVREAAAVAIFGLAGLAPAQALALSVSYGLVSFLAATPGLPMWLALRRASGPDSAP
jgi:glycosyltransferase 2 family protein